MEITRDRKARTISLSQEFYIDNVLKRFEMELCIPVATTARCRCNTSLQLLLYPHQRPAMSHTRNLLGPSYSSWADDQTDRRSSQGYCFTLGSGTVSWRSTRSSAVSLSSCEAELYAGTMAAQEARWLTFLLQELGFPQSAPTLWCDNQSTIHISQDPVYHTRTKHIELRHFFIRHLVQQEQLKWNTWHLTATWLTCSPSPLGRFPTIVSLAPWGSALLLLRHAFD
ncbi:unnamed protein product [Closterium sp. NIES-64]|nr:unnamed protein product [Closterium sp. NIES-64]